MVVGASYGYRYQYMHLVDFRALYRKGGNRSLKRSEAIRISLVAIGALLTWFGAWASFRGLPVIPLIIALIGGYPIFREALSSLKRRKMTMELSMTIAILGALAIGE